jgi:hypothetical protein
MAREVNTIMGRIISEKRGLSETKGQEIVKQMRSSNQYQEVCLLTGLLEQCNANNEFRMYGVDLSSDCEILLHFLHKFVITAVDDIRGRRLSYGVRA